MTASRFRACEKGTICAEDYFGTSDYPGGRGTVLRITLALAFSLVPPISLPVVPPVALAVLVLITFARVVSFPVLVSSRRRLTSRSYVRSNQNRRRRMKRMTSVPFNTEEKLQNFKLLENVIPGRTVSVANR